MPWDGALFLPQPEGRGHKEGMGGGRSGTEAAQLEALREQGVFRGEEKPGNSLYKVSHRDPDRGGRGRGGVLPTRDLPVRGT